MKRAHSPTFGAAAGALLLAASVAAATAAPLPARPGDSTLYRYEVAGGQKSAGQVWVVRSAAALVTVTVSPSTEEVPGTYAFVVDSGEALARMATDDAPDGGVPGEAPSEMARSFAAAVNLLASPVAANGQEARASLTLVNAPRTRPSNMVFRIGDIHDPDRRRPPASRAKSCITQ